MIIDVVMPKMGESITEGTILEWYKKIGDEIEQDETLLEIGTDKVDSEIPSPSSGVITMIMAEPNDVVDVGEVIAKIETDSESVNLEKISKLPADEKLIEKPEGVLKEKDVQIKSEKKSFNISSSTKGPILSPAVTKLANQEGISFSELALINGTGKSGRITKKDLEGYLSSGNRSIGESSIQLPKESSLSFEFASNSKTDKLDNMRKRISEHMRYSLNTSAHVHIMNEVDMTDIVDFVKKEEASFQSKEGFNLTITPFIIFSLAKVLNEMPELNSSLDGDIVIQHPQINMGIAVSVDGGLMVPSINNCDEKNLLGICRDLNDIVQKTRVKAINPDDLQGSTFTLSNFGVFGATIGTPIINQPNVGILGTGVIKKQPVVIEKNDLDIIAIRQMMMLSLGFDHRLIDGAGGALFLSKIKNILENFNFENIL
ncbi:MAG: dihydrolipoamide acetyltransferase family protein [Candidatus Marinimicrobia bacterium]|nr:dihydrolipoamide acetyltransferase family protein [Candidatus Neomarinimicrobiota bacterium]